MSFRNRCVVAGSNGLVNLSVPIEKGRGQKDLMRDVRISYSENWPVQHWRTIESCYRRAPFFEFYGEAVRALLEKRPGFLIELDLSILEWVKKQLKATTNISLTSAYHPSYPPESTDLRGRFLPKQYADEPFDLRYTQVFEERIGFMPNLSVLDLLFCCGPQAPALLRDGH